MEHDLIQQVETAQTALAAEQEKIRWLVGYIEQCESEITRLQHELHEARLEISGSDPWTFDYEPDEDGWITVPGLEGAQGR